MISLLLLALILGRYYLLVLEGSEAARGSDERRQYHRLRRRLAGGGTPALVYNRWLGWALGHTDRFFGDEGRNDQSRIADVLGLQAPGPRWTAEAFDRCLLLALVYPVISIFFVWSVSGHVGVAERALFLVPDNPEDSYSTLRRLVVTLLLFPLSFSALRYRTTPGMRSLIWLPVTLALAAAIGVAGPGAFAVALAVGSASALAGGGAVAVVGVAGLTFVANAAERRYRFGVFQTIFFSGTTTVCFVAAFYLAPLPAWRLFSPLLLFLGLLTLVNAPVDWLAVGFTRALLRRGLARGGWWPFLYAFIDVLVAAILIALLAFAMVFAVQMFDDIAVLHAGTGARTLPLGPLFDGLRNAPGAYENWWVWLLLFSSMIPSVLNLSIAAAAFLRGWPRINGWILQRMPIGKAVAQRDRLPVAAALTAQLVGGVAFTGIAAYLVAVYLIPSRLPAFGAVVRDFAQDLADYNLPARLMIWLSGAR